jgi:hypothetical protein
LTGDWDGPAAALKLDGAPGTENDVHPLTTEALTPSVSTAIDLWAATGISDSQIDLLQSVTLAVADLDGTRLAQATSQGIVLDRTAAGHGWYVDATPGRNEEFRRSEESEDLVGMGDARDRVDLLTVLAHEMGHVLGLGHSDGDDLMDDTLRPGHRRVPELEFGDEVVDGLLEDLAGDVAAQWSVQ